VEVWGREEGDLRLDLEERVVVLVGVGHDA
jgi:hypothetical protein